MSSSIVPTEIMLVIVSHYIDNLIHGISTPYRFPSQLEATLCLIEPAMDVIAANSNLDRFLEVFS